MRVRLKKSAIFLENQQRLFFKYFLSWKKTRVASADKMMTKAKGPVWHKKQKQANIVPKNLRGLDKQATWSKSRYDGWIYRHGSFSIVTHKNPVLGCFLWMPNSAYEVKLMYQEARYYQGLLSHLVMDSKADSPKLFHQLRDNYSIRLETTCRRNMDKTQAQKQMIAAMKFPRCRKYFKERGQAVEPMQGLVKEIFDLERCWMRNDNNNRWLFATMGLAVQMHQLQAYKERKSPWKIKSAVLGEP